MKILTFPIFLVSFQSIRSQMYLNNSGVVLKYTVNFRNKCRTQNGRFVFLHKFSMAQCVQECALRPICASLNYRRLADVCELFSVAEEGNAHIGSCIFMKAADIDVLEV